MSVYVPKEDSSRSVVDLSNQPICIPLYAENSKFLYPVSCRADAPDIHKTFPLRFLRNSIPSIQRLGEVAVGLCGVEKLLSGDYVQSRLMTIEFAKREFVKRKFAMCECRDPERQPQALALKRSEGIEASRRHSV